MKNRIIENWEKALLGVSLIILVVVGYVETHSNCWKDYPTIIAIITGLAGGFVATIFVLCCERIHRVNNLSKKYNKIAGTYIRLDIGQDNTQKSSITNLDSIPHPSEINNPNPSLQDDNRKLSIVIKYDGENNFSIKADYWYSKKCKVEAVVEFNESNRAIAHGRYLYTAGEFKGHFGTYTIYKFTEDDNKLLILYQHIYPRETDFNPDANRGWEIWQKN
jgi:hypothetical protein